MIQCTGRCENRSETRRRAPENNCSSVKKQEWLRAKWIAWLRVNLHTLNTQTRVPLSCFDFFDGATAAVNVARGMEDPLVKWRRPAGRRVISQVKALLVLTKCWGESTLFTQELHVSVKVQQSSR